MYQLTVHRTFSAAHAISVRGVREPLHGHDWEVTLRVEGPSLDGDGLLCDFHALEATLDGVIAPFRNASLNEVPPFDTRNPTAELVADFIASRVAGSLPRGVHLGSVSVREAPGCVATRAGPAPAGGSAWNR